MNTGQRSFTVESLKSNSKGLKTKKGGRYISKTPMAAALKAFNSECRKSKIHGQCSLILTIRETTSGSKHKVYKYKMNRKKLATPLVITKGDVNITIRYKTTAKKHKA